MGKIYLITNMRNGKEYVGQTKNIVAQRFAQHIDSCHRFYKDRKNSFYAELVEAGEDVFNIFKYKILEECGNSILNEREQYWIHKIRPLYNYTFMTSERLNLYVDDICTMYTHGFTITEIREKYKCRHDEIKKVLNDNGIKVVRSRPAESLRKTVYLFDDYGELINKYNYVGELASDIGVKSDNARMCALSNTKKGYLFNCCEGHYISYIKNQPYIYKVICKETGEAKFYKTKTAVEKFYEDLTGKYTYMSQLKRKGRQYCHGYKVLEKMKGEW